MGVVGLIPAHSKRCSSTTQSRRNTDAVRISGIFELGGRDLSVNRRLLEGVLRSASTKGLQATFGSASFMAC